MFSLPPARLFDRHSPPHITTLVLLSGLGALSMTVFLPSLAGMARYFQVDYAVMQLSVSAYLAVSGALQLVVGPIADRYGRRPVILGALVIFLLATLGTILAPNAAWFLAFRMMQAVVATGIALSRAVVRDLVGGARAASMISYVTMGMALAPMVGPVIGGALDEAFGWRASFGLLLGLGLVALVIAWADLGETGKGGGTSFAQQLRQYPQLLASGTFWGYCLAATFSSGAFFAYLGGAPFVGAEILHLQPATLGYFFAAPAMGYAIGNYISGRLAMRIGIDRMVLAGTLICGLALLPAALAAWALPPHPLLFFPFIALMALANGISLPSANAGLLSSVSPALAGSASGLGAALNIGGGAALAAISGALLGPGSGALPLVAVMVASAVAALLSILWVIRRQRPGA